MTVSSCLKACMIFHGITAMLDLLGLVAFYTKPAGIWLLQVKLIHYPIIVQSKIIITYDENKTLKAKFRGVYVTVKWRNHTFFDKKVNNSYVIDLIHLWWSYHRQIPQCIKDMKAGAIFAPSFVYSSSGQLLVTSIKLKLIERLFVLTRNISSAEPHVIFFLILAP